MFNSKNVKAFEEKISKYLGYGIVKARIIDIKVVKAKTSEARKIEFYLEGEPIADSSFEGVNGAKGKVARVTTSYMANKSQYDDFIRQLVTIAEKFGVRSSIDAITTNTIEDYIAQSCQYLIGKYAWWCVGAEEYAENKYTLTFPKYSFVKSLQEVDENSIIVDKGIIVSISTTDGKKGLEWDRSNKYHYKKYQASGVPDNGFTLPTAENVAKQIDLPSFVTPPSEWSTSPTPEVKSDPTSDLPF